MNRNLENIIERYCRKNNITVRFFHSSTTGGLVNAFVKDGRINNKNIGVEVWGGFCKRTLDWVFLHEISHTSGIILNRCSIVRCEEEIYRRYEECLANKITYALFTHFNKKYNYLKNCERFTREEEKSLKDKIDLDIKQAINLFFD